MKILSLLNPFLVAKRLIAGIEELKMQLSELQRIVAETQSKVEDRIDYVNAAIAAELAESSNAAGEAIVSAYAETREKAAAKLFSGNPDLVLLYPLLKRALMKRVEGQSAVAKAAKVKKLLQQMQSLTPEDAKSVTDELIAHALLLIETRFSNQSDPRE